MKVKMTIDVPREAKAWLKDHNGSEGTKKDFENVFNGLITAFFQDIQADYTATERQAKGEQR